MFTTVRRLLALCALALLGCSHAPAGPQVSRFLAEPLKGAGDAIKAHNYPLAIQKLQEAQAGRGQKTAYDEFIINQMLGMAYYQSHDFAKATPAFEAAAHSTYADPEQAEEWTQAVDSMRR